MKTSKLLLLTIVGLLFCVMDITFDQNSSFTADQLPKTVKTCFNKYFPNSATAYANMKNDIIKVANEEGNNSNEMELTAMGNPQKPQQ